MSRLVENSFTETVSQNSMITCRSELIDLYTNGEIYPFEYDLVYNNETENIAINFRETFHSIEFQANIDYNHIFKKYIKHTPSVSNDKIELYRPNIFFLFLVLKNIKNLGHSCETYKTVDKDIIMPKISDKKTLNLLLSKGIIAKELDITETDILIIYIEFKKYNFIFHLNK